jgi:hypothetical protein
MGCCFFFRILDASKCRSRTARHGPTTAATDTATTDATTRANVVPLHGKDQEELHALAEKDGGPGAVLLRGDDAIRGLVIEAEGPLVQLVRDAERVVLIAATRRRWQQ